LNPDRREVGKARQRECREEVGFWTKPIGHPRLKALGQALVGDEFIEHEFDAEQFSNLGNVLTLHPNQHRQRREEEAKDPFQRVIRIGQLDQVVEQGDERDEGNEHRGDIDRQSHPFRSTGRRRVNDIGVRPLAGDAHITQGFRMARLRN
jgi:hypothetical protein